MPFLCNWPCSQTCYHSGLFSGKTLVCQCWNKPLTMVPNKPDVLEAQKDHALTFLIRWALGWRLSLSGWLLKQELCVATVYLPLTNWNLLAFILQRRGPQVQSALGRNNRKYGAPMINDVPKNNFPLSLKIQWKKPPFSLKWSGLLLNRKELPRKAK